MSKANMQFARFAQGSFIQAQMLLQDDKNPVPNSSDTTVMLQGIASQLSQLRKALERLSVGLTQTAVALQKGD